jgi:hypothetical protein
MEKGCVAMNKSWTVHLEEDENGDLILPLNDEILRETHLSAGDTVEWFDNKDGSFTLKKKDENKTWVLVDCISTFRMRYMVEVPKNHPEYALDTVTMGEAKEFSQEHIGEQIVSHWIMESTKEALDICDVDNDYCKTWSDEKKIEVFFTKDGEKVEK